MIFISRASGSRIDLEIVRDLEINVGPMKVDPNSSRVDEPKSNTQGTLFVDQVGHVMSR